MVPSGADCTVSIRYRANGPQDDFVFGLAWHRVDGVHVGGHNTELDGLRPRVLDGDGVVRCRYDRVDLAPGEYLLDVAVHAADGLAYDYWRDAARVLITAPRDWPGSWAPPHRWGSDAGVWEDE